MLLFSFVVVAVVIQALTIFALQHCIKEDLLGLYWPIWTLLGLGTSIAMLGIVLCQVYALANQEWPPFATALGTPVLVVCSSGFYCMVCVSNG